MLVGFKFPEFQHVAGICVFRNGGFFLVAVRIENGETIEADGKTASSIR